MAEVTRRTFIGGLLAAPAIVKIGSLMPLSFRFEELMFRPFGGAMLSMEWITAEFARQVHNQLLRGPGSTLYEGTGKLAEGRDQHWVELGISMQDLTLRDCDFATRYISPAANNMAGQLEASGSRKTFGLEVPQGVMAGATVRARGVAVRGIRDYDINVDQVFTRLDILHG